MENKYFKNEINKLSQEKMDEYKISIPESWMSRCSGDGHIKYIDKEGDRRYVDNDIKIDDMPYRPCAKCGKYPTEDGDDYCIQNLGKVMNACCGHGNGKGYIQFDNGITLRGYFEIEYKEVKEE